MGAQCHRSLGITHFLFREQERVHKPKENWNLNPSPKRHLAVSRGKAQWGPIKKNVIRFHVGGILLPLVFYFHFCFRKFRIVSSSPVPGVCGFRPASLQVGEAAWTCPHPSPTVTDSPCSWDRVRTQLRPRLRLSPRAVWVNTNKQEHCHPRACVNSCVVCTRTKASPQRCSLERAVQKVSGHGIGT